MFNKTYNRFNTNGEPNMECSQAVKLAYNEYYQNYGVRVRFGANRRVHIWFPSEELEMEFEDELEELMEEG